jgi:hypothetical protein
MKGSAVRIRASALRDLQQFFGQEEALQTGRIRETRTPRAHRRSEPSSIAPLNSPVDGVELAVGLVRASGLTGQT